MKPLKTLFDRLLTPTNNAETLLFDALQDLKSKRSKLVERMMPLIETDDAIAKGQFHTVDQWSFRLLIRQKLQESGWPTLYQNAMYGDLFQQFFVLYENCDDRASFDKMAKYLSTEAGESPKHIFNYMLQSIDDIVRISAELDDFGPDDLDEGQRMLFGKKDGGPKPPKT